MDPFNKLPAEIRLQIYFHLRICSKRSVISIIQASPAMLQQYIISKAYIIKTSLASDLDEEMAQDATRLIQFASWKSKIVPFRVSGSYYRSWTAGELPNPFSVEDNELIAEIDRLHSRLLLFIEDYLTKATAIFPPRDYLCLPDLSSIRGYLIFKDRTICPRFDVALLSFQERRRLFRAFLRHEIICKTRYAKARLGWGPLREYGGQVFNHPEREAIECVCEYLRSLYGAMFAQCGNSWFPEIPDGNLSSRNTGLIYPDNVYFDANIYASDMCSGVSASAACFGLDLATILLRYATYGPRGRDCLKLWFKSLPEGERLGYRWRVRWGSLEYGDPTHGGPEDARHQEDSGMYQVLFQLIEEDSGLVQDIYRQRAWVFLDDARAYPPSSLVLHFPTSDELDELEAQRSTVGCDDRSLYLYPGLTRAQHRSQEWHEKRRLIADDDQWASHSSDSDLDTEDRDSDSDTDDRDSKFNMWSQEFELEKQLLDLELKMISQDYEWDMFYPSSEPDIEDHDSDLDIEDHDSDLDIEDHDPKLDIEDQVPLRPLPSLSRGRYVGELARFWQ
ncbi:hypothetical protein BGZ63DRAFT_362772 [Mariannaea sp. PMI_226]|nr:hypothetical protein BGZ63DRAFT_362772 [Mariannaea sp. PMI_226]